MLPLVPSRPAPAASCTRGPREQPLPTRSVRSISGPPDSGTRHEGRTEAFADWDPAF